MEHVKQRYIALLLLGWAVQVSALGQGTTQFNIEFPDPLPLPHIPRGGAALSEDYFMLRLLVGYGNATAVLVTERGTDGSFTPVLVCTNFVVQYVPPPPGQPGLGHDYYFYDQAWVITDQQSQSLLAGSWYAEVVYYDPTIYRAQITPVPEPSSTMLVLSGLALITTCRRRGCHSAEQRCEVGSAPG